MSEPNIAELKRLLEAATPTPWTANKIVMPKSWDYWEIDTEDGAVIAEIDNTAADPGMEGYNAQLIAALRNAAPALIAAWEELRERKISHPLTAIAAGELTDALRAFKERAEAAERERDALRAELVAREKRIAELEAIVREEERA